MPKTSISESEKQIVLASQFVEHENIPTRVFAGQWLSRWQAWLCVIGNIMTGALWSVQSTTRSMCLQAKSAVAGEVSALGSTQRARRGCPWILTTLMSSKEKLSLQFKDGDEISMPQCLEFCEWCAGSRNVSCASAPQRASLDTRVST